MRQRVVVVSLFEILRVVKKLRPGFLSVRVIAKSQVSIGRPLVIRQILPRDPRRLINLRCRRNCLDILRSDLKCRGWPV